MKNKTTFSKSPPDKRIPIFFLLICFFLVLLPGALSAKSSSEVVESKAKKVVMILDILAKEYALGVENGNIVNATEYEESQVFLDQALKRYQTVIGHMPRPKIAEELKTRFKNLGLNLKDKIDPGEVKISVNIIQSQLLKELAIEIQKSPKQPINLQNGRNIFKSNCAMPWFNR